MPNIFDLHALPAMPWKNGGGVTRELARWPLGSSMDDFEWRVSVADIAKAGPFSVFAGIDRQLLLLQGAGVKLTSEETGSHHILQANGEVWRFSGDVDIDSELIDGEVRDFNVMCRRGHWQAQTALASEEAQFSAVAGLVLVLQGECALEGQGLTTHLQANQGVWWCEEESNTWRITPQSEHTQFIQVVLQDVRLHK